MDGYSYEKACAQYLKEKGFKSVKITPKSRDQGIDIIAYKNGIKYGFQCKHYSSSVGNSAVQQAFAGARYYNCNKAVVMTNSSFTKSARDLAHRTNVELWSYIYGKKPKSVRKSKTKTVIRIIIAIFAFSAFMSFLSSCLADRNDKKIENYLKSVNENYQQLINDKLSDPSIDYLEKQLLLINGIEKVVKYDSSQLVNDGDNDDNEASFVLLFKHEKVNFEQFEEESIEKNGTNSGGTIEVYKNEADAKQREGSLLIFPTGKTSRIKTIIIRTSSELSEVDQIVLQKQIILSFLGMDYTNEELLEKDFKSYDINQFPRKNNKWTIVAFSVGILLLVFVMVFITTKSNSFIENNEYELAKKENKNDILYNNNETKPDYKINKKPHYEKKSEISISDNMQYFIRSCNAYVEKRDKKEDDSDDEI